MSKYNFEELKIKFGNNSFVDNLEKYINNDEVLKELRWFQIQKKKLNKEKNKDNYFFEHIFLLCCIKIIFYCRSGFYNTLLCNIKKLN